MSTRAHAKRLWTPQCGGCRGFRDSSEFNKFESRSTKTGSPRAGMFDFLKTGDARAGFVSRRVTHAQVFVSYHCVRVRVSVNVAICRQFPGARKGNIPPKI